MVHRGGDLARYALHEDVVGPARGSVEKLDHVIGGTDHSGLEVRQAPGTGKEALEDGAPRGQLGRRGEHVLVELVVGIRVPAGSTHFRDGVHELLREEGREIAGGRGEHPGQVRNFIHNDDVIDDEVIDIVTAPATRIARFDVQYVTCRSQLVMGFYEEDVAIPCISRRACW